MFWALQIITSDFCPHEDWPSVMRKLKVWNRRAHSVQDLCEEEEDVQGQI